MNADYAVEGVILIHVWQESLPALLLWVFTRVAYEVLKFSLLFGCFSSRRRDGWCIIDVGVDSRK